MGIFVGRSVESNRCLGVQEENVVDEDERVENGERFG